MRGELTAHMDVAQIVFSAFMLFFVGLVFWLRREDRREGYPLEAEVTGHFKARNVIWIPEPKTFTLADGRRLFLLADGRLVNISAAEGHPAIVMDMSFANQALSAEFVMKNHKKLEKKVYPVPQEIDREIARLKLASMGVSIDTLTKQQAKYLASWEEGT